MVYDFIYGAHLEEFKRFEERIARAIQNQRFLRERNEIQDGV
jgi:hypothetical protein